jgi:hypothetical protein
MGLKKSFRAVPFQLSPYELEEQSSKGRWFAARLFVGAVMAGLAIGFLSSNTGSVQLASGARDLAVSEGLMRKNRPMPGAYYAGCNEARAAGVAPLYAGEPGYRPEMDGDGDGIACEPYRGLR